jgi:hypothetical protein
VHCKAKDNLFQQSILTAFSQFQLVANTWGTNWGENGYFKIIRGDNECEIETFVIAAWARTANRVSYREKSPFGGPRY